MIRYQKIAGVNLSKSAGLPSIVRTEEGAAMGAIPGWAVLLDPAYASVPENWVRNRCRPNTRATASMGQLELHEFSDGVPAFDFRDAEAQFSHKARVNPEAWSIFFVARPSGWAVSGVQTPIQSADTGAQAGDINLHLGFFSQSGDAVLVYERSWLSNNSPTRLVYQPPTGLVSRDAPSLIMATFSTSRGLAMFDGGELVETNSSDTRPLTTGFSDDGDNNLLSFRRARGLWGMTGLLNIDLSAPENTGHRRAIENFLMTKYGIPEGPQ